LELFKRHNATPYIADNNKTTAQTNDMIPTNSNKSAAQIKIDFSMV